MQDGVEVGKDEGDRRSGRRRKRGILNKQDAVERNGAATGLMR